MEYGLFTSTIRELPADPRSACAGDWMELLPPGQLKAIYFGSEFCEDLLPEAAAESFCLWALQEGVEAVLLTPVVTQNGYARVDRLLKKLAARGYTPSVLFNDWGVLNLLRNSYPEFRRRAGRLMNRGLRDPRLAYTAERCKSEAGNPAGRTRDMLLRFGAMAVETDPDLEGFYLGEKSPGLQRVLHFPFVFAATGRNCLVKADGSTPQESFTKGLGHPCSELCRGRSHQVQRGDTSFPLWRSGNTLFYEVSQAGAKAHLAQADRVVLYEKTTA